MDILKKINNRPLVVASLGGESSGNLHNSAKEAVRWGADLLEIRLDSISRKGRKNIPSLLKSLKSLAPLIGTAREPSEQGNGSGLFKIDDWERKSVLVSALPYSDILDIELNSPDWMVSLIHRAHQAGKKVILSYHDFKGIPDNRKIKRLAMKFKSLKGDIFKVAAMPGTGGEAEKFMLSSLSLHGIPRVFIPMGKQGMAFRVFGFSFGSCLTYGYVMKPFAPGQISVKELAAWGAVFYPPR